MKGLHSPVPKKVFSVSHFLKNAYKEIELKESCLCFSLYTVETHEY